MSTFIPNNSSTTNSLTQDARPVDTREESLGNTHQTSSSAAHASPFKGVHNPVHTTTDASGYPDKRDGLTASSPPLAIQDPHEHHKFNQVQNDPSVDRNAIVNPSDTSVYSGSEMRAGDHSVTTAEDSTLDDQHHHHRHAVSSAGVPLQDPLNQPIVETMEQLGNTGLRTFAAVPNFIK